MKLRGYFFFEKLYFSLNFFLEDKLDSYESHCKPQINPMKIWSNYSHQLLLGIDSFKVTRLKLIIT